MVWRFGEDVGEKARSAGVGKAKSVQMSQCLLKKIKAEVEGTVC